MESQSAGRSERSLSEIDPGTGVKDVRSGQNTKARKLQRVQLEKTELRKTDRTVGVNYCIFSNISSGTD